MPDGDAPVNEPGAPVVDQTRRRLSTWLWRIPVLAALAGAGYGGREAWRVHFNKTPPADPPRFEDVDPTPIARLDAFAAPWDAVEFTLAGYPCLALRVPSPIPGGLLVDASLTGRAADDDAPIALAAFSRICTHQRCLVDLNLDTELIAFAFNHRGDHPQLTCACHYSVFDATRAGRVVSGPAVEPLPRVRLRIARDPGDGAHLVVADGREPPL